MNPPIFARLAWVIALCVPGSAHAQDEHQGHNHPSAQGQEHRPRATPEKESNSDYLWRKSDEAFHAGDYARAVGLHKAIVALNPGDIKSFSVASWLLWSLGKVAESNAHIERGLAANPKSWQMWEAAGQHFDLQKRFENSKNAYAKAVGLLGSDAPQMLRRRLAHASEKSGDLAGAVALWQGLVKDFPNEVVNSNNLRRVQEKQEETASPAPLVAWGTATALVLVSAVIWKKKAR